MSLKTSCGKLMPVNVDCDNSLRGISPLAGLTPIIENEQEYILARNKLNTKDLLSGIDDIFIKKYYHHLPIIEKNDWTNFWNKTSNQKLTDMNNEQLDRGNSIRKELNEIKRLKDLVEKTNDVVSLRLAFGHDDISVPKQFLDFPSIKKICII